MNIYNERKNIDVKCHECNQINKVIYKINTRSNQHIILCEDCFLEFKRDLSEMWVDY